MEKEIKNLKKAAERIQKAVENKEKIIVYGDSDMDGVSSAIILKEAIKTAGGSSLVVYFPDREEEGYGINEIALDSLKNHAPALFISLDCGIGNFKEVEKANKLGFEVIIIDHHEMLDKLPKASIVVDPKQKSDRHPFKEYANAGLTFKLAQILLGEKMPESLRKSFLELVAMATIADMMPRTDENETFIYEGLGYLESSWRPGIQALFEIEEFKGLSLMEKVSRSNALMNIREGAGKYPSAYRLLTASTVKEAKELAESLLERGLEKKKKIEEIVSEVERRITGQEEIIFEGSFSWELILLGTAASILLRELKKPVFLYRKKEEESQGSIRSPEGYDSVSAMKSCAKLLKTYGGHQRASGFTIENKNLDKFKECLASYFSK
ncbi:MAG: hypothetical protein A2365_00365 [Candidatus Nealsonbacteria bacterium RIFOXYB1_FULL_40_15]|uniref:DDH domain-containing protein n=1 Tax=Candidatus Nealsonbacteria bacterium RIFOXYB1_FULL_40_15 TaxID=1801677 RepID=A0A1G2EMW6_9BACT|nr:MAG: hypothetical protein A2365_00365 [Candidatus Nealsonbacteria bacterium RIFOXYB1_FULL_40_15]OGZ29004.1 MAG: hypothetical protein A2562_00795 [Candidatus Nealsonbacteria bacterium RIFOXYD1_FULL_39_11]